MIESELYGFCYKSYSFNICSTFPIPELCCSEPVTSDQVFVAYATIPVTIPDYSYCNDNVYVGENYVLIDIDQVAIYFIRNGNDITLQAYPGATEKEIRLYLIGSAFEAIIFQRGMLPIHGSAILFNNQAIVFAGISGCGKSTLAACFIERGYRMLSDDVCVITLNDSNHLVVHPGYPQIKLWTDSLAKLKHHFPVKSLIKNRILKHSIPLSNEFYNEAAMLMGIYFIDAQLSGDVSIRSLNKSEILPLVDRNIYRINLKHLGVEDERYTAYKPAFESLKFIRSVNRPENEFNMKKLMQCIENDMRKFSLVAL